MRRPIITQAWLADFYAGGVKPKYKGSIKRQAASDKQEVTSYKLPGPRPISNANKGLIHKPQATKPQASSDKHQAPSYKRQASSRKQQALLFYYPHKVSSSKRRGAWLR